MLEYKCELHGVAFEKADKWFPSSQLCSGCGARNRSLTLREWRCESCGAVHDRDLNAAINLAGSSSAAGRGDCVGPGGFVRSAREASTEDVLMLETSCGAWRLFHISEIIVGFGERLENGRPSSCGHAVVNWTPERRAGRLRLAANDASLLILPSRRKPNPASRILSLGTPGTCRSTFSGARRKLLWIRTVEHVAGCGEPLGSQKDACGGYAERPGRRSESPKATRTLDEIWNCKTRRHQFTENPYGYMSTVPDFRGRLPPKCCDVGRTRPFASRIATESAAPAWSEKRPNPIMCLPVEAADSETDPAFGKRKQRERPRGSRVTGERPSRDRDLYLTKGVGST